MLSNGKKRQQYSLRGLYRENQKQRSERRLFLFILDNSVDLGFLTLINTIYVHCRKKLFALVAKQDRKLPVSNARKYKLHIF